MQKCAIFQFGSAECSCELSELLVTLNIIIPGLGDHKEPACAMILATHTGLKAVLASRY
jgi:hypothetical protein